jgi:hypothetical protein
MANFAFKLCIVTLFFFGGRNISTINAQCTYNIFTSTNVYANCGQDVNFLLNTDFPPTINWQMNFGDPLSATNIASGITVGQSQPISILHSYTAPGNYIAYFSISFVWTTATDCDFLSVNNVEVDDGYGGNDPITHVFPIFVHVSSNMGTSISINGPTSVCAGTFPTFSAPTGSQNYQWQSLINGTYYNVGTNSNTYTPPPYEMSVGNHTIRVITSIDDCNSCQNISTDFLLEVQQAPDIYIVDADFTCENTNANLITVINASPNDCQGALTYAWNTGETTQDLNNVIAVANSSYTVTVTCAGGCTSTDSYQFPSVLQQGPNIDLVNQDIICNGDNTSTVSIDIQPTGSSVYVYSWSNGITTQDLSGVIFTANGVSVAVKGQNGCKTVRAFSCLNPCD